MSQNLLLTGISAVSFGVIAVTSYVVAPFHPQLFLISAVAGLTLGILGNSLIKEFFPVVKGKVTCTLSIASAAIVSVDQLSRVFFSPTIQWGFIQNQIVFISGMSAGFALGSLWIHSVKGLLNPYRQEHLI